MACHPSKYASKRNKVYIKWTSDERCVEGILCAFSSVLTGTEEEIHFRNTSTNIN